MMTASTRLPFILLAIAVAGWSMPAAAQNKVDPQKLIAQQQVIELENQIITHKQEAALSETQAKRQYIYMANLYVRSNAAQRDVLKPYVLRSRNVLLHTMEENNARLGPLMQRLQLARMDLSQSHSNTSAECDRQRAEIDAQQRTRTVATAKPVFDRNAALIGH